MASKSELFEGETLPSECATFLEFADRLNIPLSEEYLDQLRDQEDAKGFNLDAFELAVRDSKAHCPTDEKPNNRRLQNALWRAWWRQKQCRFKLGPREDERFEQLDTPPSIMFMLRGQEIGDIPTEYTIPYLQPHELPVIGTYVDPNITPGFYYRVRVNGNNRGNEFLFGGKALLLEHVGAGYGKRLTFESADLLDNDNFFWSDSNPDGGFAFSIQVLLGGETFDVFDPHDRKVGQAEITRVDDDQEIVDPKKVNREDLAKNVRAKMGCKIAFNSEEALPVHLRDQTTVFSVSGIVVTQKMDACKRASVKAIGSIELPDIGCCVLR